MGLVFQVVTATTSVTMQASHRPLSARSYLSTLLLYPDWIKVNLSNAWLLPHILGTSGKDCLVSSASIYKEGNRCVTFVSAIYWLAVVPCLRWCMEPEM